MYVLHLLKTSGVKWSVDLDGNLVIEIEGATVIGDDLFEAKSLAGLPESLRGFLLEDLIQKANAVMLSTKFKQGYPKPPATPPAEVQKKSKY